MRDNDRILINRMAPVKFEELNSLLYKLGHANHYDELRWFADLLGLPKNLNLVSTPLEEPLKKLSKFTRLDVDALQALTFSRFIPYLPNLDKKDPTRRSGSLLSSNPLVVGFGKRVCPLCLLENDAYLLPWRIGIVTSCPIHNVLLLDCCPQCGEKLSRKGYKCGTCGSYIKNMGVTKVLNDNINATATKLIWSSIGCSDENFVPSTVNFTSESPLNFLDAKTFIEFVYKFVSIQVRFNPKLDSKYLRSRANPSYITELDIRTIHQAILSVIEILIDWPSKYWDSMNSLAEVIVTNIQQFDEYPSHYPFTKSFFKLFSDEKWIWLWDSLAQKLKTANSKDSLLALWASRIRRNTFPVKEINLYTRRDLILNLGIPSRKASELVKNAHINSYVSVISSRKGSKPNVLYFREDYVQAFQNQALPFVNLNEAQRILGLSRSQIVRLIKQGVLKREPSPIYCDVNDIYLNKEAVETLLVQVTQHLKTLSIDKDEGNSRLLSFDDVIRSVKGAGIKMNQVLLGLIESELVAYKKESRPKLNEIILLEQDVKNFRDYKAATKTNGTISYNKCSKLLGGVSEKYMRVYAEVGILVPEVGDLKGEIREWRYSPLNIFHFKQSYISTKEVATIIGRSSAIITTWVSKGIINCAVDQKILGGKKFIYKKDEIIRWRDENLTSVETQKILGMKRHHITRLVKQSKLLPVSEMGLSIYWFKREDVMRVKSELDELGLN